MSEITPNTPNPVREDAYVEELAEKLGIDPQYIPKSPVWRNEEEIAALAEMFANMAGSSGGGVLVVHLTWNEDNSATLDKTWQEIHDADAVVIYGTSGNEKTYYNLSSVSTLKNFVSGDTYYYVVAYMFGENSLFQFKASSADGYPVYVGE